VFQHRRGHSIVSGLDYVCTQTPSPDYERVQQEYVVPSRKVNVDDLVGAAEIADRLGLAQPQTVHAWRRRYADFPEPVARLKNALIWSWPDVERWAALTGRTASTA